MKSCVHCGEDERGFVEDEGNGLICSSCGMVVLPEAALKQIPMQFNHLGEPQIVGKLIYDEQLRLGNKGAYTLHQYKVLIQQAGVLLGAGDDVTQQAELIFDGFAGELGRVDVRIGSALYAACQECRKPVKLATCLAAAGVPENTKNVKSKVLGVYKRQKIVIPYQNPESSLALRLLEQHNSEVVQVLNKSVGRFNTSLCLQRGQDYSEILQTTKKLVEFFDISNSAQVFHTAVDRMMVALIMASNYHRQPIKIAQDLKPVWTKLSRKFQMTTNYPYKIYTQIRRGIECWCRKNLAQKITQVAFGKFELRYFDVIFALFDLHKQLKEEEISEKLSQRFQSNKLLTAGTSSQQSENSKQFQIQNKCMGIQALNSENQQIQNQVSQSASINQNIQNQQLGQYIDNDGNDGFDEDDEELSQLDDDEICEFIKSKEEVLRDSILSEFFDSVSNFQPKSRSKNMNEQKGVKRKR
eukprot:TRINITY_DN4341_c0_g1_i2.p1 TRINITY_DN4341_c0_g1~~TRINITY_DN4341_c0_g1_i2.p1  ORF type:complete len:497 (-),score=77.52 TRINITY_DN4341_c0_g1_i2:56-1462(-)